MYPSHITNDFPMTVYKEALGLTIPTNNCRITFREPVGQVYGKGICFADSVDDVLEKIISLALQNARDICLIDREGRELTIL